MLRNYTLLFLIPFSFCLSACGGSESSTADGREAASPNSSRFTKDMTKACDLLTAERAGAALNFPAEKFKQTKILGCMYTWKNETEQANAHLSMIYVHNSSAQAAAWFSQSTANRSAAEVQAEMDQLSARLQKSDELDTGAKKSAAKSMLKAVGADAIRFEDVAGVGDEARASDDGSIYVRVGNLTFVAAGYKGAKEPDMDYSGLDVKEMIAAGKQHSKAWTAQTLDQRTQDGVQIATAIVEAL